MPKNVLAPIDDSTHMEGNVRYACEVAKSMGSKLTLVHVVVLPTILEPGLMTPTVSLPASVDPRIFEELGLKILEKAKDIAKGNGVAADTRLLKTFGNPAQQIVNAAEDGKFDLIVIGAKGRSLLRNLTVGSVCDTVVHNAPCPVLVLR